VRGFVGSSDMANRQKRKASFRSAVQSMDPYRVAAVMALPPVSSSRRGQEPPAAASRQADSMQENGLDWSAVLTAWLDACEAAEAVR
jgi:hypothetical protein